MFEQVLKKEIGSVTISIFKDTKLKESRKSKNYLVTHYQHYPEDETLKTIGKRTFCQAWKAFFIMENALRNGTKIKDENKSK